MTPETNIGKLIERYPGILEVLEEHGIRMDPTTYILLHGDVRQAAEYNAIQDLEAFRRALERFVEAEEEQNA